MPGVEIFHAGTRREGERILADGGRVLERHRASAATWPRRRRAPMPRSTAIDWPEGFCRRDIGWRAIAAQRRG